MPKFNVTIQRTATRTKVFTVEADTSDEAASKAMEIAPGEYFEANETAGEYEVERIHQV